MLFSDGELEQLALRAATVDERLSEAIVPDPAGGEEIAVAAARLNRWCHSASKGDGTLFAERLSRDGLSPDGVLTRLGPIRWADAHRAPWLADAAWICDALAAASADSTAPILATLPFSDLYQRLVESACRRRDARLSRDARGQITGAVVRRLNDELLSAIARLCAPILYGIFDARRKRGRTGDASGAQRRGKSPSDLHLRDFAREMRESGWRALFEEKPILMRLIVTLTQQWIETTAEFVERLSRDRLDLAAFLGMRSPNALKNVEMGMSDPHRFGRSVYILEFSCGRRVVYKPKDLRVEQAWADIIGWLNSRNPPVDLRAPRTLVRQGYGWSQHIEVGDLADHRAAERFVRRLGAIMCLLHLLGGTDMHGENIIAAADHPIPIDLETLFTVSEAEIADDEACRATRKVEHRLSDSVLVTGFLPCFIRHPNTEMRALGGLIEHRQDSIADIGWRDCNTDSLQPVAVSWAGRKNTNLPRLNGTVIGITDYVPQLLDGCRSFYEFAYSIKNDLLAETGPLSKVDGVHVRRVFRRTQYYALLLQRLRNHREMSDGAIWSAQADFTSRIRDWAGKDVVPIRVYARERAALLSLNIPYFVHRADGGPALDGVENSAIDVGMASGIDAARRRIHNLDGREIDWQLHAVEASIEGFSTGSRQRSTQSTELMKLDRCIPARTPNLRRRRHMQVANQIAETIASTAVRAGASAAWYGLNPVSENGGWALSELGHDIYGGTPGVALFLAAHAKVSGSERARALTLDALRHVRHIIAGPQLDGFAQLIGVGGASGLGGLIYAFCAISEMLEDPTLLDDARVLAAAMSSELIRKDRAFDVIAGCAGAILGLLKLSRCTADDIALSKASECGRHLLQARSPQRLWSSSGGQPLAGFSHGAAGFAYALSALSSAGNDEEFAAAARDCLSYERGLFSEETGNWPDLRGLHGDPVAWPCQWCHGATGIGLSRIGLMRIGSEDETMLQEVTSAVQAVRRHGYSSIDTLCCGNSGNIDFLTEAAETLDQPDLMRLARHRATVVADAAAARGQFGWYAGSDRDNLGLFSGLSGIGYMLLRLENPKTLPNVMLWG